MRKFLIQKKIILITLFFLTFSLGFSATEFEYGVAYDNYNGSKVGFFGEISSKLSKKTDINAKVDYFGGENYQYLVSAKYSPFSFTSILGGFSVSQKDNKLIPGLYTSFSLFTPKSFKFSTNYLLELTSTNMEELNDFGLGFDFTIAKENSILDINTNYLNRKNFQYNQLDFDVKMLAYGENVPIKIGLGLFAETVLDFSKKRKLNITYDFEVSTQYEKDNSTTIIAVQTQVFNFPKKKSQPYMISLSKKVTY